MAKRKGKCQIKGPFKSKRAAQRARKSKEWVVRRLAYFTMKCPK